VKSLIIGIAQISTTCSVDVNVRKFENVIRSREKAEIVVLPEYFMINPEECSSLELIYEHSQELNGGFVKSMAKIARDYDVGLVFTFFEKCRSTKKVYNTAIFLNNYGEVLGAYRKIHLFDAYGYSESRIIESGNELSPIINYRDTKFSLAICFDIRFPELFRIYAIRDCEVCIIPSAWYRGDLKEEILIFLARSRAHENGMYIIIANQYSEKFTGRSMIVDPYGAVLLDLSIGEKYVEYRIDVDEVYKARSKVPILKLRKPELYREITQP